MIQTRYFNLIVVGENMPVSQVKPDDFEFGDFEVVEKLRIPFAFELTAGPFRVLAMAERYQISVEGLDPTGEMLKAIQRNAGVLAELAGRRSITAIGHNLQSHLAWEGFDPVGVSSRLLAREFYTEHLGLSLLQEFETAIRFAAGDADAGTLKLAVPPERDRLVVDINYNFDIPRNLKTPRPSNAIDRLADSISHAREMTAKLAVEFEGVESRT